MIEKQIAKILAVVCVLTGSATAQTVSGFISGTITDPSGAASMDTSAQFNPAGQQVNARFGALTAANPGRVIQIAMRFTF